MGYLVRSALILACLSLAGCAAIETPDPVKVIKNPLGTTPIKQGMTKAEVESIWGKPDQINQVEDSARWKAPREEWVYHPSYGQMVPIDAGYLSKTKRLYFDGDNLTDITG